MEILSGSPRAPLLGYSGAAAYCGLNTRYFTNLHKEGRGPGLSEAIGAACVFHARCVGSVDGDLEGGER